MKKITFALLMGSIALGSCKKLVEKDDLDKQIDIHFVDERIDSEHDNFQASSQGSVLKDFDRRDYKYIDSITLNLGIMTASLSDTAIVRLYNLTDGVEIANARVKGYTNGIVQYVEFNSNNILSSLPDKRITLVAQISSSTPGKIAYGLAPYLKLRRN
jgi:hypothetical protein